MSAQEASTRRTVRKGHSVTLRRRFAAAPEEVFSAWVDPELIERWWGPAGVATRVESLDLRVDGAFRFVMLLPNGSESVIAGVYLEIERPRRLVFGVTEQCNRDLPEGETPQLETALVTVAFRPRGAETEVVVRHEGLASGSIAGRFESGWGSSLACLAELFRPAEGSLS